VPTNPSSATETIKKQPVKSKKDSWDIYEIRSGAILTAAGVIVTILAGIATARQGSATVETTNRQIASSYLDQLTKGDAEKRAALLNAIDVALQPDTATRMSVRFAAPVTQIIKIKDRELLEDDKVRDDARKDAVAHSAAIEALERLKKVDTSVLREIANTGHIPDSDIASEILGESVDSYVRLTEIDDEVVVSINKHPPPVVLNRGEVTPVGDLKATYVFGADSGWVNLEPYLKESPTIDLDFLVKNTVAGGAGLRLQLRMGIEQYDFYVDCRKCPPTAESFKVHFNIAKHNYSTSKSHFLRTQDVMVSGTHLNNFEVHPLPEERENSDRDMGPVPPSITTPTTPTEPTH
jgi:hypothetical protein